MSGTYMLGAAATGAGDSFYMPEDGETTFQASGTTTAGSGAATIAIQVSNDASNWITAGTITLTLGTSATTDGFALAAKWKHSRANVTALSGTGAAVSVYGKGLTK